MGFASLPYSRFAIIGNASSIFNVLSTIYYTTKTANCQSPFHIIYNRINKASTKCMIFRIINLNPDSKEIKVTRDGVILTYTTPLLPDGESLETIGVLGTDHYGGPFWTRTRDLSLIRTAL